MKNLTKLICAVITMQTEITKLMVKTVTDNVEPIKGLTTDVLEMVATVKAHITKEDLAQEEAISDRTVPEAIKAHFEAEMARLGLV